jgi:hypothetical protein
MAYEDHNATGERRVECNTKYLWDRMLGMNTYRPLIQLVSLNQMQIFLKNFWARKFKGPQMTCIPENLSQENVLGHVLWISLVLQCYVRIVLKCVRLFQPHYYFAHYDYR